MAPTKGLLLPMLILPLLFELLYGFRWDTGYGDKD